MVCIHSPLWLQSIGQARSRLSTYLQEGEEEEEEGGGDEQALQLHRLTHTFIYHGLNGEAVAWLHHTNGFVLWVRCKGKRESGHTESRERGTYWNNGGHWEQCETTCVRREVVVRAPSSSSLPCHLPPSSLVDAVSTVRPHDRAALGLGMLLNGITYVSVLPPRTD